MNRRLAWSLVAIQLALLVALVFLPPGDLWPRSALVWTIALALLLGAAVLGIVAGVTLGRQLTPNPIPRESGELVVSGVYRLVRHPIYSALMLVAVGLVLLGASLWHFLGAGALFILLGVKARVEERLLRARFDSYLDYQGTTGRFFPGIGRIPGDLSGKK